MFLHHIIYTERIHSRRYGRTQFLVEMRGVEPLSENIAIQLSPSADVIFCFALRLPDDGPSHRYPIKVPLRPTGVSYKVSHN